MYKISRKHGQFVHALPKAIVSKHFLALLLLVQLMYLMSSHLARFIELQTGDFDVPIDFSDDDDLLKYDGIDDANILLDLNDFDYIIPKPPCNSYSDTPQVIAMVHSAPLHTEQRQAMRESWAKSDPRLLSFFILGSVPTKYVQKQIEAEDAEHNDIIQGNFADSYHNLTYKHVMLMKWASTNCPEAKYILKLDDDVFPNIPMIFEYILSDETEKGDIIGQYFPNGTAERQGKWKVEKSQFKDNYYMPYAHSYGVLYSLEYARAVYRKARKTRFFWIDDVFVNGLVGLQLNAKTANVRHRYLEIKNQTECITEETDIWNMDFLFTNSDIMPKEMHVLWNKTSTYFATREEEYSVEDESP